jgi:hypothetical protein
LWDLTASAISHQDTDFDDDSVVSSDENTPSVTSRDVTRDDHTVTDDVITCDPPIGVTRSRHTATVTPEQAEKTGSRSHRKNGGNPSLLEQDESTLGDVLRAFVEANGVEPVEAAVDPDADIPF